MEKGMFLECVKAAMAASQNGKFFSLVYEGEPSGFLKRGNPYYGRVTKVTKVSGIQFGVCYTNKMNNALERNGGERDFIPQPMKGRVWYDGYVNVVEQAIKDGSLRLRVTTTEKTRFESVFFLDGRIASEEEVAAIKAFIPKREMSPVFSVGIAKIKAITLCHEVISEVATATA